MEQALPQHAGGRRSPVLEFMQAVAETGYDGYLSLEIFNDQFRGGLTRRLAADGYRSLIYLGDQVRRCLPQGKLQAPAMFDPIDVKKFLLLNLPPALMKVTYCNSF